MEEIATRLHENKQIRLAKEILENAGYKVTKKLEESKGDTYTIVAITDNGTKLFYNAEKGTFSTEVEDATEYAEYEIVRSDFDELPDLRGFDTMFISADYGKTQVPENSDSAAFQVGDVVHWSGLYGGQYTGKIKDVGFSMIRVDVSWVAEDTGETITKEKIYPKDHDSEGNECIIVWEYHGEKGYLYPPSMDESKKVNEAYAPEYLESMEEFRDCIKKAFDILESTEEGVLESAVHDDELRDRLLGYLEQLNTNLYFSKNKNN